jgi:hypothetical protein
MQYILVPLPPSFPSLLASTSSSSGGFFGVSPKGRRQEEVVQRLADMIGSNVKLYDMTLQGRRI